MNAPPQENRAHGLARVPSSPIRVVLRILAIVAAFAFGAWILHKLAALVLVLTLAALFAYAVAPLVRLAERPIRIAGRPRGLSRTAAVALVYVLLAGGVSAGAALLVPAASAQVDDMVARAPAYTQSILTWERSWTRYYERLRIPIELRKRIDQSVLTADDAAIEYARGSLIALAGTLSYIPRLLLIPILAFFFLTDATDIRRALLKALPHHEQLRGHRLFEELHTTLVAYIKAQLLACVLVGTLCGVGFAALGIPYAVVLGVLAGILEFIPLVGPLLLAAIAAIVGALHAPMLALWAVVFLGILRLVEDYAIYPRLIRRGVRLPPLAVIVAILIGAELDGIAGMFLAVPAAAMASVVYRHWLERRSGDDVAPAPHRTAEASEPTAIATPMAERGEAVLFGTA